MTVNREINFKEIPVRINKTIKDVLEIYSRLQVPRQALMEDYMAVITTKQILEAHNPWLYYHKGVKKQNVEQGVSLLETAFIEGAMKLAKQKPTDVIRAVFYTTRNDSALECGYLLEEYEGLLSEGEDTLIINPSPDMILLFEERRAGKGNRYYVVTDRTIKRVYSEQFREATFWTFDDEITKTFPSVLVVNRDCPIEETFRLMRWLSCCTRYVIAQIPNAYFDNVKYGAEALLKESQFDIEKMLLLDSKVTVTKPRKKCVVYLGKNLEGNAWRLLGSEWDRNDKVFRILDKDIDVKRDAYWKGHLSLLQIWDKADQEEVTKEPKYEEAKRYIFSDEISLFYNVYGDRGNRYAGRGWYRKLMDTLPVRYGKRVSPLIEKGLRARKKEDIEKKLWEIVFDERVYPYVYTDIQNFYVEVKKPMSIKTLWVLSWNRLRGSSLFEEELFEEMFAYSSEGLSSFCVEKDTLEDLLSMLEARLQIKSEEIPVKYYRQLHLLFESARKERYILYNPLAEWIETVNKRASERQQDIRQVLTKKHFLSKEEEKIFAYLVEPVWDDFYNMNVPRCVAQSIWLVGAIRLFTGMSLREACALRWSDFVVLEGTTEYQLLVSKFLDGQGKVITHAQKEDWTRFRCVPVAHPLKVLLEQRKKYLRDRKIDEATLEQSPIALGSEEIKSLKRGGRNLFCKPAKAQEYCKRLVEKANLTEQLLILPDAKGEMITDVHKYHGDIFVSNLRRQLNHYCKMTMGEINYILGIVGTDTFSRHYCDYSNEMVLYAMIQKMNRWTWQYEEVLSKRKDAKASKGDLCANKQVIKSGPFREDCASSQIILRSQSKTEETIKVTVECEHGAKVEITKYRGE